MFGSRESGLGIRNSSAAVSCGNAFPSSVSRLPPAGFTLLEILAVLAVIGLALAVTAFNLDGGLQRAKLDGSARDIAASLRHTRTVALMDRQPQWFTLDLKARSFASPGREAKVLDPGTVLHVTSAAEDADRTGIARIRFFPDGSSTGGHIELARAQRAIRIDVDWLTGAVAMSETRAAK